MPDVRAFVEETQSVRNHSFRGGVLGTIAERVGRDIDDAHDARALAERQHACAELPVQARV